MKWNISTFFIAYCICFLGEAYSQTTTSVPPLRWTERIKQKIRFLENPPNSDGGGGVMVYERIRMLATKFHERNKACSSNTDPLLSADFVAYYEALITPRCGECGPDDSENETYKECMLTPEIAGELAIILSDKKEFISSVDRAYPEKKLKKSEREQMYDFFKTCLPPEKEE